MNAGDRVYIKQSSKHPWAGEPGTLVAYEQYGPSVFSFVGWKVRLDNGTECYAKPHDLLLNRRNEVNV